MGWSWYLGDDMIFFLITIIILPIYARRAWVGWAAVISLTLLSFGLTSYYMVKYHLDIYAFGPDYADFSYWVYSKPYARIPAYFVGTMTAWLLVIFIPATDYGEHAKEWSIATNALFVNLARPLFAAGWAVITLLCYYDYVPLLNGFLSHPCWTPLARLTYGAYLVHPLVIKLSAGNAMQFYTFNSMDLLYRFTGNALLTTMGSVALWALCERPCMTIFSPSKKGKNGKRNSAAVPSAAIAQEAKDCLKEPEEALPSRLASTAASDPASQPCSASSSSNGSGSELSHPSELVI